MTRLFLCLFDAFNVPLLSLIVRMSALGVDLVRRQQLFRIFLFIWSLVFAGAGWTFTFNQSAMSLQRFLEENPSQLPLIEQLSVRVHSQPIPLVTTYPETQKIAVVLRDSPNMPQNQAWFFAFKRRMQELNIDFRLDVFHAARSAGTVSMVQIYEKIQSADFDYVIADGVDDYNRPLIERLLKMDDKQVILLNSFAPYPAWHLHPPLLYIGTDVARMMQRLASLLHRALTEDAIIDAILASDEMTGQNQCQMFLNELSHLGRGIRHRYQSVNSKSEAHEIANDLLQSGQHKDGQYFIFACTPDISEGVVAALEASQSRATTNAWLGQNGLENAHQKGLLMVTVLEMKDYMAIAAAEAIKADMESRLLPRVFSESVTFLTQEMDQQTRNLIFQQALQYSSTLWPR